MIRFHIFAIAFVATFAYRSSLRHDTINCLNYDCTIGEEEKTHKDTNSSVVFQAILPNSALLNQNISSAYRNLSPVSDNHGESDPRLSQLLSSSFLMQQLTTFEVQDRDNVYIRFTQTGLYFAGLPEYGGDRATVGPEYAKQAHKLLIRSGTPKQHYIQLINRQKNHHVTRRDFYHALSRGTTRGYGGYDDRLDDTPSHRFLINMDMHEKPQYYKPFKLYDMAHSMAVCYSDEGGPLGAQYGPSSTRQYLLQARQATDMSVHHYYELMLEPARSKITVHGRWERLACLYTRKTVGFTSKLSQKYLIGRQTKKAFSDDQENHILREMRKGMKKEARFNRLANEWRESARGWRNGEGECQVGIGQNVCLWQYVIDVRDHGEWVNALRSTCLVCGDKARTPHPTACE